MILKVFDHGWGNDVPLKQFEKSLTDQYLAPLVTDDKNHVIINSVWYTDNAHKQVMAYLRTHKVDSIVLIAMLDAAIPYAPRYQELAHLVNEVGYYRGKNFIDFWALMVDRYFDQPGPEALLPTQQMTLPFMCLNRKPHWHRKKLYVELESRGLLDHGLVSFGGDNNNPVRVLATDQGQSLLAPNPGADQHGICNDIASLGHPDNWQRCFLNVVTETVFDININYFVSEKIYKPIIGQRPFLVYDTDGATQWLTDRGFQSYVNDFTDISDLDLTNPDNIAPFLLVLSQQNTSYYYQKYLALSEKIMYNKQHFDTYVQRQYQKIQQGIQCQI